MRRIIRGKTYNTETAMLIAEYAFGYPGEDDHFVETLYQTGRGAFFLAGRGAARSFYATLFGSGMTQPGEDIIPLADAEAQRWLEDHAYVDAVEALFGVQPEAGDGKSLLCCRVAEEFRQRVEEAAANGGLSVEDWVTQILTRTLNGSDRGHRFETAEHD